MITVSITWHQDGDPDQLLCSVKGSARTAPAAWRIARGKMKRESKRGRQRSTEAKFPQLKLFAENQGQDTAATRH